MSRTLLMFRSVAFAFVTKLSGAATVFIGLPIIAHSLPVGDYAIFLATMNIAAAAGLVFAPFGLLYIRELSHAFASEDRTEAERAVKATFGCHAALTAGVLALLTIGFLAMGSTNYFKASVLLGISLNTLAMAASWGQVYRIAERSDYVTSIIQTMSNIIMVASLATLSITNNLTDMSVSAVYFGVPAMGELLVFSQLLLKRRLRPRLDRSALAAFKTRVPRTIPLFLAPISNYVIVYGISIIVLSVSDTYNYIVISTSILLIARIVNPVSLITRPMMPAFIDARQRNDIKWLVMLKRIFLAAAAIGAVMAAILPFIVSEKIIYFAFPKEVHGLSLVYLMFCSYFAFSYALVTLLEPLFIGAHRASFYGLSNLAFTLAAAAAGTLFGGKFGAAAMMGALAISTTLNGLFLLAKTSWTKDSYALKHDGGRLA
ncbi:MAG: hypothetical protein L0Y57_01620 [Beijerinckiaceae bacterium]|nr:hypothetical protein [Beijerinckiaceae bacterium]